MSTPLPNDVPFSLSVDFSGYVGEYIPNRVEDVRLRIERVRLKVGVSVPPLEAERLVLLGFA